MVSGLRRNVNLYIVAIFVTGVAVWLMALWPKPPELCVTFLDVGQGDCAYIRTPSGKVILVDGGGTPQTEKGGFDVGNHVVMPFLRKQGVNRVNLVIATHPHEDHISGLVSVLKQVRVDSVLDSAIPQASGRYQDFLSLIDQKHIKYYAARAGMKIDLGDSVVIDVFGPERRSYSDVNDLSVVIRLEYGRVSFMMMGDCQDEAESDLCGNKQRLRSTVLKVGHHGSAKSTTAVWLQRVRPKIAVISVGENNQFGHPSPAVLKRLETAGCRVYRTDIHGAVTIRTNGKVLRVFPTRSRLK